jgi:hypothetical protein
MNEICHLRAVALRLTYGGPARYATSFVAFQARNETRRPYI